MSDIAFSVIVNNNGIDDIVFKTIMLKGDKGNSVDHVEKTSTSGLVDTYTIYLTDGTIGGTFTVTNGSPVNIDDTVTAIDKTWSSNKLSGMIKSIDDNVVSADKLWSSQKINSMLAQTGTIEDVAIASFSDGADDVPLSELTVDIEAWQEGSGEPSPDNERAIHGWNECNLSRCGLNLFDEIWEDGYINSGTGAVVTNLNYSTTDYIKVTPNTQYYCKATVINSDTPNVCYYDSSHNKLDYQSSVSGFFNNAFTTPNNANICYMRLTITNANVSKDSFTVNYPASDTTYHAYTGDTATIEFGQMVYGGQLDVMRGKLTSTFNGFNVENGNWSMGNRNNADNGRIFFISLPDATPSKNSTLKASCFKFNTYQSVWENLNVGDMEITSSKQLIVCADYNSLDTFKTGLTGNTIIYELSTPFDIDLTPTEVRTLLNANNIYADTGNVDKIVYFKTGSEAVAKLIEAYMRAQPEE